MNIYYEPEKYGLKPIGEIDWSSGSYEFDLTVVWQRELDGVLVYAEDSGCSCPSPFESAGVDDLVVLRNRGGLNEFKAHCEERQKNAYDGDRSSEVAQLVERMHAAGAR